jgi:uncharacterized delta-60 repeat protein
MMEVMTRFIRFVNRLAFKTMVLVFCSITQARSTVLDKSFSPLLKREDPWASVQAMARQPDGKIIISGDFTEINGVSRMRIARINADGSLDGTFDPGDGLNQPANCITIAPDGRIYLGGGFTVYRRVTRNGILRLNADGALDQSFNPVNGLGGFSTISSITVLNDGRLLVETNKVHINLSDRASALHVMNVDGSMASGSAPPVSGSERINCAVRPDGRIYLGGNFAITGRDASSKNQVCLLNSDLSLSSSFTPVTAANDAVGYGMQVTPDGGVITMGYSAIAKVSPTGTIATLAIGAGTWASGFSVLAVQSDGKLLVTGSFVDISGSPRNRIARLNADGSLDTTFDALDGIDSTAQCIAIEPNGNILVGGWIRYCNGRFRTGLARYLGGSNNSPLSTNAYLDNLLISEGSLAPAFDLNHQTYGLVVPNGTASVRLLPHAMENEASIQINGINVVSGEFSAAIPLSYGLNTISIKVRAEDQTISKTYTVTVTRALSAIATLSNLTVGDHILSPTFSSTTTNYTVNVSYNVSSMSLTPTSSDSKATVRVNDQLVGSGSVSQPIQLQVGSNTIEIKVAAQDGTTIRIYTLTIDRAPSTVATLSDLKISATELSPSFNPTNTVYTAKVINTVTSIRITPTTSEKTANILVNGVQVTSGDSSALLPLVIGTNAINVKVIAGDGITTMTYYLYLVRAKSSDAALTMLSVKSATLSPAFKSSSTEYSAKVSSTTKTVKIMATTRNDRAKIKINGIAAISGTFSHSLPLATGKNLVTISVTADDRTTRTYKITITRKKPTSSQKASRSDKTSRPPYAMATISKVMVNGHNYLQMTVRRDAIPTKLEIEVSPNLIDWYSGENHTTILENDTQLFSVRDKTPFTSVQKRYIRLKK